MRTDKEACISSADKSLEGYPPTDCFFKYSASEYTPIPIRPDDPRDMHVQRACVGCSYPPVACLSSVLLAVRQPLSEIWICGSVHPETYNLLPQEHTIMAATSTNSPPSLLPTARSSITSFLNISQTSAARGVHAELAVLQDLLRSIADTQAALPPSTSNRTRIAGNAELEGHLRNLTTLLPPKPPRPPSLWSKRQWADTLAGVKAVREKIATYHARTTPRVARIPAPTKLDADGDAPISLFHPAAC